MKEIQTLMSHHFTQLLAFNSDVFDVFVSPCGFTQTPLIQEFGHILGVLSHLRLYLLYRSAQGDLVLGRFLPLPLRHRHPSHKLFVAKTPAALSRILPPTSTQKNRPPYRGLDHNYLLLITISPAK